MNVRHKEDLKASSSKGVESLNSDADHGNDDNGNEMATYRNFTTCDVPKFDGTLNLIASTRWLSAVEGMDITQNGQIRSQYGQNRAHEGKEREKQ
ncbi:hypothetical protein Tco_1105773 [Tanacetum coccineum]